MSLCIFIVITLLKSSFSVFILFLGPQNKNKDKVKEFYTNYVWNSLHSDNFLVEIIKSVVVSTATSCYAVFYFCIK